MNQTESHSLKEKKMSKFDAFLAILQKKVTKFSEKLHFCKNKMKKNTFFNRKNEKKMYSSYNIHYKLSNDTKIESFDDILVKS